MKLADEPRAVSHMPVLFKEFEKAGTFDRMREVSMIHGGAISYRRTKDQQIVDRILPLPHRPGPLTVPQRVFTELLINKLEDSPNGQLLLGHRLADVEKGGKCILVTVEDVRSETLY